MGSKYVIGLDFGTDSVRALVVNAENGKEEASSVSYYNRWSEGKYCDPSQNQFRQHPLDYMEGLEDAINGALAKCEESIRKNVIGIGVDTTGSTPCPVDKDGTPLALRDEYKDNPDAMFILWKDHTAVKEAEEINEYARNWGGEDYTRYEGGVYSSEWFWSKIIHVIRGDEEIRDAAYSWVEHCDWVPAFLTGNTDPLTMKRSRCAAGHKAMWHEQWGGLPDEDFLTGIEPKLEGIKEKLYKETYTSDEKAGGLTEEWAEKLGLEPGIAVAVGAFDAHMGAVGGEISEKTLVKIMGTSTCDIIVAPDDVIDNEVISGVCGQVDGSVIPDMIGLEAGQSAFGDVYAWFKDLLSWPLESIMPEIEDVEEETKQKIVRQIEDKILIKLTEEANKLDLEETGLIALDWLNGRRTPFADQMLKGAIIGLDLGTDAPKVFRALVEATVFGSKAIVDQFIKEGVEIDEVLALGGISKKNDFVMQTTSNILNMPIKIVASEQTCALGAAMFGAVAAGKYENIDEAQQSMGSGFDKTYSPQANKVDKYQELYEKYVTLGADLEDNLRNI